MFLYSERHSSFQNTWWHRHMEKLSILPASSLWAEPSNLCWIRWHHQMEKFSALLALCAGIHQSPLNSLHKGHWRRTLIFSLICVWINGWVNNCGAGNLRRHRAHHDVIVMSPTPTHYHHPASRRTSQLEWMSNFIPHITGHVITYPCWD